MLIKFYSKLSPELLEKQQKFELKHFYEEKGQGLINVLMNQQEKFFSNPKGWIIAKERKEIVGQVLLFYRDLPKENLTLGGIGGVCTHRKFRHRGIALKMLNRSIKILKKWNCDLLYLNASPITLEKLYLKVNFVPLKKGVDYLGRSGIKYTDLKSFIAPLRSNKLFQEILNGKSRLFIGEGNW